VCVVCVCVCVCRQVVRLLTRLEYFSKTLEGTNILLWSIFHVLSLSLSTTD